jgi:hypothetical protein
VRYLSCDNCGHVTETPVPPFPADREPRPFLSAAAEELHYTRQVDHEEHPERLRNLTCPECGRFTLTGPGLR